jgi:hypothetical protein
MEGRVYNCSWSKGEGKFRTWVVSDPRLVTEAASLQAADKGLWSVICEKFGDGENVREYQPPLPPQTGDECYLADGLSTLVGNSRAEKIGSLDPLFVAGRCSECGAGLGGRSDVPLTVGFIESGFDSTFIILSGVSFYLYSEDFLSLLTTDEQSRFSWEPVRRTQRSRKAFFECRGIKDVPFVTIRNAGMGGWECGKCGHRVFGVSRHEFSFDRAVCSSSLEKPLPQCFSVGPVIGAAVCVTQQRWMSMRGKLGARGIALSSVGVVSPNKADRHPVLPIRFLSREGYLPVKN